MVMSLWPHFFVHPVFARQNAVWFVCECSGAVAQDGRIEPGDMILEVNGVSFEDMTNDEAVQTLRTAAQRPGSVSNAAFRCFSHQQTRVLFIYFIAVDKAQEGHLARKKLPHKGLLLGTKPYAEYK